MATLNAHRREILVSILRGKSTLTWGPTLGALIAGEYVDAFGCLTSKGEQVAREHAEKMEADRKRRNAAARGRSDAMRSVGMRRYASGWE